MERPSTHARIARDIALWPTSAPVSNNIASSHAIAFRSLRMSTMWIMIDLPKAVFPRVDPWSATELHVYKLPKPLDLFGGHALWDATVGHS